MNISVLRWGKISHLVNLLLTDYIHIHFSEKINIKMLPRTAVNIISKDYYNLIYLVVTE